MGMAVDTFSLTPTAQQKGSFTERSANPFSSMKKALRRY